MKDIETRFVHAVKTLQARNQSYVDKNGVNDYSRKTDEIIKTLVDVYNYMRQLELSADEQSMKFIDFMDEISRLKLICNVYGINVSEFDEIPLSFFQTLNKTREVIFTQPPLSITMIKLKFWRFAHEVQSDCQTLEFYYGADEKIKSMLREHYQYLEPWFKQIDHFEDTDITGMDAIFEQVYTETLNKYLTSND